MLGEACALGAALTWSCSIVLFKRSEAVSPLAMNLFKNVVAASLLAITLPLLGGRLDLERSPQEWVALVLSGVLGIALADTMTFMALRRLGASLLAVVDCSYAPTMVVLSVLLLDERLSLAFGMGAGLVVCGVLLATRRSRHPAGAPAPPTGSAPLGVALGVGGIVIMGLGVILAKPALARGDLVEVTLVRLVAGVAAQLVWMALLPGQREALQVFRAVAVWRTLLPASVLGSYVAMLFWLGGFKWGAVSVSSALNQLSSVLTIILARLVLAEQLSARRLLGALLALAGAVLVLTLGRTDP